MTIYDPIEITLGGDGGFASGQEQVGQVDGFAVLRGRTVGGGVIDTGTYVFVKLSWGSGDADGKLPTPRDFAVGDPNVYYKVTIQAIDASEEE